MDDIQQLQHWFTIEHWLGETFYPRVYDWREHSSRLYPLVSERGYDLIAQEDTAILQVADRTDIHQPLFGDAEDFELRKKKAICYDDTAVTHQHNSSAVMGAPPTLSHKALLCLARFYERDYELLKEVQELACKTDECQLAIQSILTRRADLLAENANLKLTIPG